MSAIRSLTQSLLFTDKENGSILCIYIARDKYLPQPMTLFRNKSVHTDTYGYMHAYLLRTHVVTYMNTYSTYPYPYINVHL